MRYLRTNTAVNVTIGPFLDYADGLTPKDTLTVTGITGVLAYDDDDGTVGGHADFTCSASGGDNDLVAVGHNGLWTLELTAAQVNHLGRAILSLTAPTQICPVFHEFQILAANVYDSLFAGVGPTPDLLDVNAAQVGGGNYKVASTTGAWATPGTWADGAVPSAGDKIVIKSGINVTVEASLDLGQFGPWTILGTLNIGPAATVATVPEGCTVTTNGGNAIGDNYGRVITNNTMIWNNRGQVDTNAGTIDWNLDTTLVNSGTVATNNNVVVRNAGTVGINYGIIELNNGEVTTPSTGVILYGTGGALPVAAAGAANGVVLGSAAYKLAVDSAGKVAVSQLAGITSLAKWLRAFFRKSTPDSTALSEINTDGGTYNAATDSAEVLGEQAVAIAGDASAVHTAVDDATNGLAAIKTTAAVAASMIGQGSKRKTVCVRTAGGVPIDGVEVTLYGEEARTTRLHGPLYTNAQGIVTFDLDVGEYFPRYQHSTFDFPVDPDSIVVT
jgi:hypothetical protein